MRIDIHAHAFHPKIARKAVEHLNSFYTVHCEGDGTVAHLLEREAAAGVDACVVLCAATTPSQVVPANTYAIALGREHPGSVVAFGALHPGYGKWEEELARLRAAGIRGIKLHPDFQGFRLDDPRLWPIFEAAQEDFIFEIHVGDHMDPQAAPSCPYKLAAIADAFPRLRLIGAHFAGYRMWAHSLRALAGRWRENLWLDTSSTTPFATERLLRALLAAFPRDRLLFGTDWPLYDPPKEAARLQALGGLSDAELEGIMGNAASLLGLG